MRPTDKLLTRDAQFIERPAPFAEYSPEFDATPRRLWLGLINGASCTIILASVVYVGLRLAGLV